MGAYARGPGFCWVHCQHAQNGGALHGLTSQPKWQYPAESWPWHWPWAHPGCRLTWGPSCPSLVAIRSFACEKKRFIARTDTGRLTRDRHDLPRAKVTVPSWKLGTTSSADTRECMRITDTRTDGQTDRRTNRQTDCDDAVRAHMTERIIKFPARPFTGCGPHLPVT